MGEGREREQRREREERKWVSSKGDDIKHLTIKIDIVQECFNTCLGQKLVVFRCTHMARG